MAAEEMNEESVDEGAALGEMEKPRMDLIVKVDVPSACERHVTVTIPRADVDRYFDDVFSDPSNKDHKLDRMWASAGKDEQVNPLLAELGFRDPEAVSRRLSSAHDSARYKQLPNHIRSRLDALVPRVVEAAAETRSPDDTLTRCLDLLETISRRGAYLEAVYRINRRWEAGYRFDRLWNGSGSPIAGDYDPRRNSVMLSWLNSEFSLLRLQYSQERPNREDTDNALTLQYQMNLGAHGAHKF